MYLWVIYDRDKTYPRLFGPEIGHRLGGEIDQLRAILVN
jgi:hypothetical protein